MEPPISDGQAPLTPATKFAGKSFSQCMVPAKQVLDNFQQHGAADDKQEIQFKSNLELINATTDDHDNFHGATRSRRKTCQKFLLHVHHTFGVDACITLSYSYSMTTMLSFHHSISDWDMQFKQWWETIVLPEACKSQFETIKSSINTPNKVSTRKRSLEEVDEQASSPTDQPTAKRIAVDGLPSDGAENENKGLEATGATEPNAAENQNKPPTGTDAAKMNGNGDSHHNIEKEGTYWSGNMANEVKVGPVYTVNLKDAIRALADCDDGEITVIFPNTPGARPFCTFKIADGTAMNMALKGKQLC